MICLRCARCCLETEMILTPSDIIRLVSLGYKLEEFAVRSPDGFYRLRNVDGHCYFLDPETRRCKIYEHRPLGCRLYPIIYDLDRGELTVDRECPMWHTVTEEDLRAAVPLMRRLLRELGLDDDVRLGAER